MASSSTYGTPRIRAMRSARRGLPEPAFPTTDPLHAIIIPEGGGLSQIAGSRPRAGSNLPERLLHLWLQ